MATTTYGSPYVDGTDLVANWPAASLTVAQSIDAAGYYIGRGNNTQTGSYTTVLTDAGKVITMSNASANTVTIPPNSSVAYVIGTRINILNLGAGACTPTAGAGVTINGTITALATNGSASVIKTATNTWSYIASGGGGKVLQVVHAIATAIVSNTTSTYADVGLSASITCATTGSKVLVLVNHSGVYKGNVQNTSVGCRLLRDATTLITWEALGAYNNSTNQQNVASSSISYLDSPASVSALTYKTQFASLQNLASAYVNNEGDSSICLMEIGA